VLITGTYKQTFGHVQEAASYKVASIFVREDTLNV